MTIEGAIETILRATPGVTAIAGTRIYTNTADQESEQTPAPYIVIITDDINPVQTCDGASIEYATVYTDIYHTNIALASALADQIKTTLQDYEGIHGTLNITELWQTNTTMARNDEVDKHIYRLEWQARISK